MSNWSKRFTYIFGIVLVIAMGASTVLPLLRSNVQQAPVEEATATPQPTLPPPPDTDSISFDETYLHPSGLFTVAVPTGWTPTVQDNSASEARVSLFNNTIQSVIEARIINQEDEVDSAEGLNTFFSDSWLGQTWRDYTSWEEASRETTEDGHLLIDFNLSRRDTNYIARQEAWIQDGEIYTVRVVTAQNAPQELKLILQKVAETLAPITSYEGTPFEWSSYFDNTDKHMIRYPGTWTVTNAADGLPATIESDDLTLVVETLDVALEDEDDATDWMENWRSGVTVLTVNPVDYDGTSGFEVSYSLATLDGTPESGTAVLLNGSDNRLHVANLRLAVPNVDLQTDESEDYASYKTVLSTFRLFPELNITEEFAPVEGEA